MALNPLSCFTDSEMDDEEDIAIKLFPGFPGRSSSVLENEAIIDEYYNPQMFLTTPCFKDDMFNDYSESKEERQRYNQPTDKVHHVDRIDSYYWGSVSDAEVVTSGISPQEVSTVWSPFGLEPEFQDPDCDGFSDYFEFENPQTQNKVLNNDNIDIILELQKFENSFGFSVRGGFDEEFMPTVDDIFRVPTQRVTGNGCRITEVLLRLHPITRPIYGNRDEMGDIRGQGLMHHNRQDSENSRNM
ncbi:uncharacterized protein LOC110444762, partial [Mizuhopecten yessoensis]